MLKQKYYQVKNFIEACKIKYKQTKKHTYEINKTHNNNEISITANKTSYIVDDFYE
jgi:hypothetical protein